MFRFCPSCGAYGADKTVDPDGPAVVCPECGKGQPFRQPPLLVVGGASGVGKSTVRRELVDSLDAVLLDVDAMWEPAFSDLEAFDHDDYYLRRAKNVAQSGPPVVLFGAEVGMPGTVESSVQRRYFSAVHYLALVCDDDLLAERLRDRHNWDDADDRFTDVDEQVALNRWYRTRGDASDSPVEKLDVTDLTVPAVATRVETWVEETLADAPVREP